MSLDAVLDYDEEGNLIRKSGIMSIVTIGGEVKPGDTICVELPPKPYRSLARVWVNYFCIRTLILIHFIVEYLDRQSG